mgnify:CR=1 FL=1
MSIKRYSGALTIEIHLGDDDAYHAVVRHGRIVLGRSRFDADKYGYGSKVYSKVAARALRLAHAKDEAVGDLAAMDDDDRFRVTLNKRRARRNSASNGKKTVRASKRSGTFAGDPFEIAIPPISKWDYRSGSHTWRHPELPLRFSIFSDGTRGEVTKYNDDYSFDVTWFDDAADARAMLAQMRRWYAQQTLSSLNRR